ncbi:MAG: hypothetical protein WED82_08880, partial [Balneolales bacterium]
MSTFLKTITAVSLFLFLSLGEVTGQISNPTGELGIPNSSDIWAQTLEGNHFNEFWSYHFYLDEGLKVHATFSVANFGNFKSAVSGLQLSVSNLNDDEVYQVSREYPIDQLVQDKENHTLRLHPEKDVYFEGKLPDEHRVHIKTSKDGENYDIDLTFDNIADGVKWDQGEFTVGDEKIGIVTHIPYAEVSGHVSVNDRKKDVNGTAYMDHTYQNQTTTRLLHSGYRFVYHNGSDNWDILYFLYPSTRNSKTIGYRLVKRENKIVLQGAQGITEMTRSKSFEKSIAQDIQLKIENSNSLTLSRSVDEEMFSVFSEL